MIDLVVIVLFLAIVSFGLGIYFRVAEYDILAADRVWERIAPNAKAIVSNDAYSDRVAFDISMFSVLAGCGCFTNAMLVIWFKTAVLRMSPGKVSGNPLAPELNALPEDLRGNVLELFNDMMLFDSLHAPILGRVCRVIYREAFSRKLYRPNLSDQAQTNIVLLMAMAAEDVVAKKAKEEMPQGNLIAA
ncbi:hypothetical protein A8B75_18705 [Sphingomonadales bacterium EhC05]|nr:hypothetical protein A8B75_18705 [Sphingomonadales bacterium EhC05]